MPHSRESTNFTKPLKGRRSLQSILQPSFTPLTSLGLNAQSSKSQSASPARRRAHTHSVGSPSESQAEAGRISPPFLLDEDPFANLSSLTMTSPQVHNIAEEGLYHGIATPSPLNPNSSSTISSYLPSVSTPSRHLLSSRSFSQSSFGRSSYRRLAFTPRPSLPSLSTLSQMDMRVPVRVKKGKVGASLPPEPWETIPTSPALPEHVAEDGKSVWCLCVYEPWYHPSSHLEHSD